MDGRQYFEFLKHHLPILLEDVPDNGCGLSTMGHLRPILYTEYAGLNRTDRPLGLRGVLFIGIFKK